MKLVQIQVMHMITHYQKDMKICVKFAILDYHKFICDSVDVKNHNQISKKYIHESHEILHLFK